jgi:hemoglobin
VRVSVSGGEAPPLPAFLPPPIFGWPRRAPAAAHVMVNELDIYALIGEEGFARLIAAFYRQVPTDAVLGPMYPAADLAGAEQRLRDFLIGRFGGPPRYIEQRGHPRLRQRHMPFRVSPLARDRWLQLMTNALDEAQFPPEADALLREFFGSVATMLINQPS